MKIKQTPYLPIDQTPYLNIVNLWAQGIHVSSTGKQCNLADISPAYLQNIINKFSALGYDTSALLSYLPDQPAQPIAVVSASPLPNSPLIQTNSSSPPAPQAVLQ